MEMIMANTDHSYAYVPMSLIGNSALSHVEFRLLVLLMCLDLQDRTAGGRRKGYVDLSRAYVAKYLGITSLRFVSKLLTSLEAKNFIERKKIKGITRVYLVIPDSPRKPTPVLKEQVSLKSRGSKRAGALKEQVSLKSRGSKRAGALKDQVALETRGPSRPGVKGFSSKNQELDRPMSVQSKGRTEQGSAATPVHEGPGSPSLSVFSVFSEKRREYREDKIREDKRIHPESSLYSLSENTEKTIPASSSKKTQPIDLTHKNADSQKTSAKKKGAKSKTEKKKGAKPKADSRVKHLVDYYYTAYLARFEVKYSVSGAKDAKQFKDLLKDHSETTLESCIDLFLDDRDDWLHQEPGRFTLPVFRSRINRYLQQTAQNGRPPTPSTPAHRPFPEVE